MVKYIEVFQIKDLAKNHGLLFTPMRFLKKMNLEVSLNNYKSVYKDHIIADDNSNDFALLEKLYCIFQISKPATYNGHSLSVSDIVRIDETYYFCDSIGFVKLDF